MRTSTAALPAGLAATTVKAGVFYAASQGALAYLVPAHVSALLHGVTNSMFLFRLMLAALLVAVCLAVSGVGLLTYRTGAAKSLDSVQAAEAKRPTVAAKPPVAAAQLADESVVVRGRVLSPDGKPFAGARVFLWTSALQNKTGRPVRATTGLDGCFRFAATQEDIRRADVVMACADGYGPDWVDLGKSVQKAGEVTLRLARDDLPISGRIVDLEGRPIAGAMVQVRRLEKRANDGDLTPWIAAKQQWARGNYVNGVPMKSLAAEVLDVPASVTTDPDGRFRLVGFGRERVVHLKIHGKDLEDTYIEVITRTGSLTGMYTGDENDAAYGASFERVVGPCKPIIGRVRERGSGKPLAGISLFCPGPNMARAVTDAQGSYRVNWAGKRKDYTLAARGLPYFNATKYEIRDTQGFEPLIVDFELDHGIELRVRVTDRATGKPVPGALGYEARADNPHLPDFPSLRSSGSRGNVTAEPDGWQRVLAIPGPGWLLFKAEDTDRYIPPNCYDGYDSGLLPTSVATLIPGQHHRVVPIDLPEKNPKPTTYDIVLEPGKRRIGTVIGADGQALAGTHVAGLQPVISNGFDFDPKQFRQKRSLHGDSFTARGLDQRRPRTLVFYHAERKLGKVQTIRAADKEPLTVRLEPLGAVSGRVIDAKGRPWAGLTVRVELSRGDSAYRDLPWELLEGMGPMLVVTQSTDRDGRFRLDGLVPGLKYDLSVAEGAANKSETANACAVYELSVQAGKVKDLAELKSKLAPGP